LDIDFLAYISYHILISLSNFMGFIKRFKEKNGDLFVYLKAEEVHPHDYFLAKTVLRFFPEWITPNRITVFRIIATPVVFFLALYNYHVWSIIAFILVASTDALDGSLARTEDKITRFGMLFDPLADKFLVGSLILVLVFRYLNPWLGIAVLGIEIIFIVSALVARVRFQTVRMANQWGKIKMILQVFSMGAIMFGLALDIPAFFAVASGILGLSIGFALLSLFRHGF
jgi:CDP-diacylglycerol--glycerol-3-phosphate 3-phosphatidyltransferase